MYSELSINILKMDFSVLPLFYLFRLNRSAPCSDLLPNPSMIPAHLVPVAFYPPSNPTLSVFSFTYKHISVLAAGAWL